MKKSKMGRLFSLLLAAVLVFTSLPETVHASGNGVIDKLNQLQSVYPNGKYWWRTDGVHTSVSTNPCTTPTKDQWGNCASTDARNCASNYLGYQCVAFAGQIFLQIFGEKVPDYRGTRTDTQNIMVGDYVRMSRGHSFIVVARNGNTLTAAELNWDGPCRIRWGGTHQISEVSGFYHASNYDQIVNVQPSPPEPEHGQEMTGPFAHTISDGDYHIVSSLEGDKYEPGTKCLGAYGMPANKNISGANAELQTINGLLDQVYTVTWIDAYQGYTIKLKNSDDQRLDVAYANTELGANVQHYEGAGIAKQWVIDENADADGDGYCIRAKCSGYYLDVAEGSTANGTNVRLYNNNDKGKAKRWYFIPWAGGNFAKQSLSDGEYEIVSKMDGTKVLGTEGTNIALRDRTDDGRYVFQTNYLGQGYYKITNKNTGKALDVYAAYSQRGTKLILSDYWDSYNEQFLIKDCGGGDYQIVSRCNGLCVDVADAVMKDGQEIHVWSYEGLENQKWKFVPYKQPVPDTPQPDNPNPDQPTPDNPEPDRPMPDKPSEEDTDQGEVLDEDIPDGGIAKIPQGLWMSEIAEQSYTGKAVKPAVRVYDHKKLLTEKKDYTISYKNNIKAAAASDAKAPTITVAGRGNYTGKDTQTFTILPKSLADEDIFAYDMAARYTGRIIKSALTVVWNGKQLSKNKDYTYQDGIYSTEGSYQITVRGKGNFCGERKVSFMITRGKLASAFRVSKLANCLYTGNPITPELIVKDGKVTLKEGTDYIVTYRNNIQIGTAEALVTGMGDYAGVKTVSFKILPAASLNKADAELTFDNGAIYTGNEVRPTAYRVTIKGKDAAGNVTTAVLTEGEDYVVSFQNHIKAGTATIIFRGINAYSGTLKKKYRIAAYDVGGAQFGVSMEDSYAYVKGGCKPEPVVTFRGKTLIKGTDYTLTYRNHMALSDDSGPQKQPTVIIRGRGCFTGSLEKYYSIVPKDMGGLAMKAADKTWQNRKNIYRTKVTIKDTDGKNLSAGRDYDKALRYEYNADTVLADGTVRSVGTEISKQDIIPAGTTIRVTAFAKGTQYTGQISCCYRITKTDIAKARVTIPAQIYTGREIRPDNEIKITLNGQVLSAENYEVTGYRNNVNKGTAALTIQGRNDCGGTKTVRFRIKGKGFLWWWR